MLLSAAVAAAPAAARADTLSDVVMRSYSSPAALPKVSKPARKPAAIKRVERSRGDCQMAPDIAAMLRSVRTAYGALRVNHVCTGRHANHSWHYRRDSVGRGLAVDFRKFGNVAQTYVFIQRTWRGCIHHYGGGLFHMDVGSQRGW